MPFKSGPVVFEYKGVAIYSAEPLYWPPGLARAMRSRRFYIKVSVAGSDTPRLTGSSASYKVGIPISNFSHVGHLLIFLCRHFIHRIYYTRNHTALIAGAGTPLFFAVAIAFYLIGRHFGKFHRHTDAEDEEKPMRKLAAQRVKEQTKQTAFRQALDTNLSASSRFRHCAYLGQSPAE